MDVRGIFEEVFASPWAIGAAVLLGGLIAGRLLVAVLRPILTHATRRTEAAWDDQLVDRMASPVSVIIAVQAFRVAVPWLELQPRAEHVVDISVTIATTAAILWIAFRGIDLAHGILAQRSWAIDRPSSKSLLAIGARFAKVTVVLLGAIVLLAQLGVSVASLVAGLGIGGLALALAAQKTVENLFGTLSIGVDQPMREGDFVKIGDTVGTVEEIGLRSTRVRTLARTLVTLPNGDLANQRIESYTARDRIHLYCVIGLVYQTTAAQMRGVLEDLERILRAHPQIWDEAIVVRFIQFNASSLDIEIRAWFQTTDFGVFQGYRQDVLLSFMEAIEARGTSIAYPTQTLHLEKPSAEPVKASA